MTPSQPIEARGTARVAATEEMIVLCIAAVNDPDELVKSDGAAKTRDSLSTALPAEGVASGVLEGVID